MKRPVSAATHRTAAAISSVAVPAADDIGTIRDLYDGALLPDLQVNTLRHVDRLFPTRAVARGAAVHDLPVSARRWPTIRFEENGVSWDLFDYLSLSRVSGLLVIKNGEVAFEH